LFFKLRDTTNNNGDIEFDLKKKVLWKLFFLVSLLFSFPPPFV
jgi:hypothetical protein